MSVTFFATGGRGLQDLGQAVSGLQLPDSGEPSTNMKAYFNSITVALEQYLSNTTHELAPAVEYYCLPLSYFRDSLISENDLRLRQVQERAAAGLITLQQLANTGGAKTKTDVEKEGGGDGPAALLQKRAALDLAFLRKHFDFRTAQFSAPEDTGIRHAAYAMAFDFGFPGSEPLSRWFTWLTGDDTAFQRDDNQGANTDRVLDACKRNWPKGNLKCNCSGFAKVIAGELGIFLPSTQADGIIDHARAPGSGWTKLANGVGANQRAEAGQFVLGVLKSDEHVPKRANGHIVVVTGHKPLAFEQYPAAYWGGLPPKESPSACGGKAATTVNWSWNKASLQRVEYYEYTGDGADIAALAAEEGELEMVHDMPGVVWRAVGSGDGAFGPLRDTRTEAARDSEAMETRGWRADIIEWPRKAFIPIGKTEKR
jgi:hypothetical protein